MVAVERFIVRTIATASFRYLPVAALMVARFARDPGCQALATVLSAAQRHRRIRFSLEDHPLACFA
jgi:hypothetical protein